MCPEQGQFQKRSAWKQGNALPGRRKDSLGALGDWDNIMQIITKSITQRQFPNILQTFYEHLPLMASGGLCILLHHKKCIVLNIFTKILKSVMVFKKNIISNFLAYFKKINCQKNFYPFQSCSSPLNKSLCMHY